MKGFGDDYHRTEAQFTRTLQRAATLTLSAYKDKERARLESLLSSHRAADLRVWRAARARGKLRSTKEAPGVHSMPIFSQCPEPFAPTPCVSSCARVSLYVSLHSEQ